MTYIREKSIAWYATRYWKKATVCALSVAVITATTAAFACDKQPKQAELQPTHKTQSETNFEAFTAWNVPLDEDLQLYVFELGERYGIEPELILAVIGQESNYRCDMVGDGGASVGLMQVQKKWHQERMEKYNVTDLLNPYENVLIGTDYLAECIEKGGLEWGLMAYNGGASYANEKAAQGVVSEYAEGVLMLAELLKEGEL